MIELLNLFLFLVIVSFFFIILLGKLKQLYLGRRKSGFSCLRCGKCCTLRVKPGKEDIESIVRAGYRKEDFLVKGWIKMVNGACCFLRKRNGFAECAIYEHRPRVCRNWPFSAFFRGKFIYARLFNCPGLSGRCEK